MMNKNMITAIVLVIAAGALGFFGGMKYQQTKTPASSSTRQAGLPGAGGGAGRRNFGGANGASFVGGEVISADNTTLTVKNMNGGSQVVILAPSTQYRKAVEGTASDVVVGSQVTVTGSTNSDGSLTAQTVQIRSASSTPPGMPASK